MMNNNGSEYDCSMQSLLTHSYKLFHLSAKEIHIAFLLIYFENKWHVNMN